MKKYFSLFLICVLVGSLLAGCNNEILTPPDTEPTNQTTPTKPSTPKEPIYTVNASKMEFDTYVLDSAYAETSTNTMFSPLSLDMALGMVAEGAGSEYHNIFTKLLGKNNYSEFAAQYLEYLSGLNEESDSKYNKYKTVFEIANSIWIKQNYMPIENFEKKVGSFSAEINTLDFENLSDAVFKINSWCNEKTHGMIKEVVKEESFSDDTRAVVINAVYFESPWMEKWIVSSDDIKFNLLNNEKVDAKMMKTTTSTYYENDYATAFGCQYKNGLTFIGILPKESGDFLVGDLDITSLLDSKTSKYDVFAVMPSFKFNNKIENLKDILSDAGYGILFDNDMGIFTQMIKGENGNVELTISDIIQMDAIELDENGTKAAAVTSIIMNETSSIVQPKEIKEVILDRPFAFIIYDSEMNQIVFMGKVVNPA